jgi:hypothetical protein
MEIEMRKYPIKIKRRKIRKKPKKESGKNAGKKTLRVIQKRLGIYEKSK